MKRAAAAAAVVVAAVAGFAVSGVAKPPACKPVWKCQTTTSTTVPATTTVPVTTTAPTTTSASSPSYPIRGVYDRDLSASGFDDEQAVGFNVIDSGPYPDQMAALEAAGLKGMVWLGGYDNTTCRFNESDDWVASHVAAIAGDPAVAAYFIDDEPNSAACPSAPQQVAARSALVKSIDPVPPTLLVVYRMDQLPAFAGTVDVVGLDHYPCSYTHGCDYQIIDDEVAAADRLGIRYWGVVQAFGDDYYRLPTADELREEFARWRASKMSGYLVYAWRSPHDADPSLWLANHPELLSVLQAENGS